MLDFTQPVKMTKAEGENVVLFCNASGVPTPSITWYRLNRWQSREQEREHLYEHCLPSDNVLEYSKHNYTYILTYVWFIFSYTFICIHTYIYICNYIIFFSVSLY